MNETHMADFRLDYTVKGYDVARHTGMEKATKNVVVLRTGQNQNQETKNKKRK